MRIYQDGRLLTQAAYTQAKRLDNYTVEVTAVGLDAKGDATTFRLLVSVNEALLMARVASEEPK